MTRTHQVLLLAAVAMISGAWLQVRAADPDDETPPPAFDKEAGYRRRYAALPPEPPVRITLVSLALKGASPKDAAAELGKAAGFKIRTMPPGYLGNEDLPKVTLELDKKPALEALLELACQTGTTPEIDSCY